MEKSDFSIAWKWAQWPTVLGSIVGATVTTGVLEKVTKKTSLFEEFFMYAVFCGLFALLLGGAVFCIALIIIKLKKLGAAG